MHSCGAIRRSMPGMHGTARPVYLEQLQFPEWLVLEGSHLMVFRFSVLSGAAWQLALAFSQSARCLSNQ